MKKNILYMFAFIVVIFASCNPLDDAINEVSPNNDVVKTMELKLTNTYASVAAAEAGISTVLNSSYGQLSNGSSASVTYNFAPSQIKPADSLLSSTSTIPTQYAVTDADYLAINGNGNKNFNATNVIKFLDAKFPAKVEYQLIVLNYTYYQGGVTTSTGAPVVETFMFRDGAWFKPYHVSEAQYKSAGKLTVFNFGSSDEVNLIGYFNTFLKSDAVVAATAKVGDVRYVSYTYFSNPNTYQRIRPVVYDGTNWGNKPVQLKPITFVKKNGTWIPDPTVYYTLVKADFQVLTGSTVASAAAVANAVSFASYDKTGGANNWTDEEILKSVILILNNKYASAPADPTVMYEITYVLYRGSTPTVTKTFVKTSTGFVFVPSAD